MAMPTASLAGHCPCHHSQQSPWLLFCPLLSSSFLLCCSSTAVQQGRVGEGRRKKFGGVVLHRKKKNEKAVLWGLSMWVALPLLLSDPPFQTHMIKLTRIALSKPRVLQHPRAQARGQEVPSMPGRGTARPGCSQTHSHTHTYQPPSTKEASFISCERRRWERGNLEAANSSATYLASLSFPMLPASSMFRGCSSCFPYK